MYVFMVFNPHTNKVTVSTKDEWHNYPKTLKDEVDAKGMAEATFSELEVVVVKEGEWDAD